VAKLRHLAISTANPDETAEFFENLFSFKRVGTLQDHPLADGHFLSDGSLNVAILRFKSDQGPIPADRLGLHHFGVVVDDLDETLRRAVELGGIPIEEGEMDGGFEHKFVTPEGLVFDIVGTPWIGSSR